MKAAGILLIDCLCRLRRHGGKCDLNMQAGQPPFMGKIVVPEAEGLPGTVNKGCTGEIHAYPVTALIL